MSIDRDRRSHPGQAAWVEAELPSHVGRYALVRFDESMVIRADECAVVQSRRPVVPPGLDVVPLAGRRWRFTAGKAAAPIAQYKCLAQLLAEQPPLLPDVERNAVAAKDSRQDAGFARQSAGLTSADR